MTVKEIQKKFKLSMAESLSSALEVVGDQLNEDGDFFDEYVTLKNRVTRMEMRDRKGILSYSDYNLEYNKLMDDSLIFISKIDDKSLKYNTNDKNVLLTESTATSAKPTGLLVIYNNIYYRYVVYIFAVIGLVLLITNIFLIITND